MYYFHHLYLQSSSFLRFALRMDHNYDNSQYARCSVARFFFRFEAVVALSQANFFSRGHFFPFFIPLLFVIFFLGLVKNCCLALGLLCHQNMTNNGIRLTNMAFQKTGRPLHTGHLETEESDRCGEVAVTGRLGCNMIPIFSGSTTYLLCQAHAYCSL